MLKFVFQSWRGTGFRSTPLGKSHPHHRERKRSSAGFAVGLDTGDSSYPLAGSRGGRLAETMVQCLWQGCCSPRWNG